MKKDVFEIPKNINAGIYMLYNTHCHKVYVGETQNFHLRALQHKQKLLSNTHSNKAMQSDFNKGDEFIFAVIEDMGQVYDKDNLMLRERQYILSFRDSYVYTYNNETTKQIKDFLFRDMVRPTIDEIKKDFYKNFGCYMYTLKSCKSNTLKDKFTA